MERSGAAMSETGMGRRDQILMTAVQLFRTSGYDRTSLREIAGNLGLSKSGLYHHFPSKEALLASLVDPLLDDLDALLQDHQRELEPADRRALLPFFRRHPSAQLEGGVDTNRTSRSYAAHARETRHRLRGEESERPPAGGEYFLPDPKR